MPSIPVRNSGSFRDAAGQVFEHEGRILRGLSPEALSNFESLRTTGFYNNFTASADIVRSRTVAGDSAVDAIKAMGWAGVIEHDRLPLISYPYEWAFTMLRDAALLQLELLERAFAEGWTLKDATSYNVQYTGSNAVFIDVPSFVPRTAGEPWLGYRQFCMTNLYPLLLESHLNIPFQPLLRSKLDGVAPIEASRYFQGLNILKRGVMNHVILPAKLEQRAMRLQREAVAETASRRPHSDAMVLGIIQSLKRLVGALRSPARKSAWSDYAQSHSYGDEDLARKLAFVDKAARIAPRRVAWDLGSNTGAFSKLLAAHAGFVVAVDSDHESVERLYRSVRQDGQRNILPLVADLTNLSPDQGWNGSERIAFDKRNKPDLVICLAVIHHMSLSANIPIAMFLDWLGSLGAQIVIEFVDRDDEMVQTILRRKQQAHPEYCIEAFDQALRARFAVLGHEELKGGCRRLYFAEPRPR